MNIIKSPQYINPAYNPVIYQFGSTYSSVLYFDINVNDIDSSSLILSDKAYVTPVNPTGSDYNISDVARDVVRWDINNYNTLSAPLSLSVRELGLDVSEVGLIGLTTSQLSATQSITPFLVWNAKLNRLDYNRFNYREWIVLSDSTNVNFLTDKPDYFKVNDFSREYLYFNKDYSQSLKWRITTLNNTGGVITSATFSITDSSYSMRLDVSPKVLNYNLSNILNGSSFYKIELLNTAGTPISDAKYFRYVDAKCNLEIVNVLWENNLGGIDSYQFQSPLEERDVERITIRKNEFYYDSNLNYVDERDDIFNQRTKVVSSNLKSRYKLWTAPLSDLENEWIAGLLDSRNVWIELNDGRLYPVTLAETNYTINIKKYVRNEYIQSQWTFEITEDYINKSDLLASDVVTTSTTTTTTTLFCPITTGFTASATHSSINASWSTMGGAVVSYEVTIIRGDTPGVELPGYPISTTASSYSFTGLASDTDYYIYVRSVCGVNTSSYSELLVRTTTDGGATTTTTSTTTTTTTTAGGLSAVVYASLKSPGGYGIGVSYRINGGAWNDLSGGLFPNTCGTETYVGAVTGINSGDIISIAMRDIGNHNDLLFACYPGSSACSESLSYCGRDVPFEDVITSNMIYYIAGASTETPC